MKCWNLTHRLFSAMKYVKLGLFWLLESISQWVKNRFLVVSCRDESTGGTAVEQPPSEEWKTNQSLRTFHPKDGEGPMVTIRTSSHDFHVDLQRLSQCSEYFRALSQSRMRENWENLVLLEHIPSLYFYNLLQFSFNHIFTVTAEELHSHIQVGSYLLANAFLSKCLSVLSEVLSQSNCTSYLSFANDIICVEMKATILDYVSRNLLELPHVFRCLSDEDREVVFQWRTQGDRRVCSLRKENLSSCKDPETEAARHLFALQGAEPDSLWLPITALPFTSDKWCFTAVVLYNYLYLMGGFRQHRGRGWGFTMAAFRYNPFTDTWTPTAPLIKHRRHFSAVACEGAIYAVGGWYLDSLLPPDSCTAMFSAVERYDPWKNSWRFVSSLPLTDFQLTMSLSHDVPLSTSLGQHVYVLGSIHGTGELLLLQYHTKLDFWCEILPTLTRVHANLPALYFLGATDRLLVIGGNNSENVVTSYSLESQTWGQVFGTDKVAFAGQGTAMDDHVLIPSVDHDTVVRMDLQTLALTALPPRPVSTRYEATFYLCF